MTSTQTASPLSATDFINWLAQHGTPKDEWRIGTEHEKFLYNLDDLRPVAYEGKAGVAAVMQHLQTDYGFTPIIEAGNVIGLKDAHGGSISLEPGGQFELSGAPLRTVHETCSETRQHLQQTRAVTERLGLGMLALGFQPLWGRADTHWMPKGRYKIMRDYMPKKGNLGLDMMLRSCTVQVNLDYADEADMRKKFRTSLALQPVATALFANSPFMDGKPSGFKSTRAHIWTDTDPDRCGVPPCVFDAAFGYEQWIEYILDVPMYFLYRDGQYLDVSGLSFRDYMQGKLPGYEGEMPTMADFEDHITTAFPEVRLKGYLEMRGADGGSWKNICAQPALWAGLLYDEQALDEAAHLIADLSADEVAMARLSAAKDGLAGQIGTQSIAEVARRIIDIAHAGLARRAEMNADGEDETIHLLSLKAIIADNKTNADIMLEKYYGAWDEDVRDVFSHYHY